MESERPWEPPKARVVTAAVQADHWGALGVGGKWQCLEPNKLSLSRKFLRDSSVLPRLKASDLTH